MSIVQKMILLKFSHAVPRGFICLQRQDLKDNDYLASSKQETSK